MLLEQDIAGDSLILQATSLTKPDDAAQKVELPLFPRDEGGVKIVEVTVLNEECEEFMPKPSRISPELKNPKTKDRIFESFYKLSKTPPPPDQSPIPVADYLVIEEEEETTQPAQSAPPCSPSRTEPYI